MFFFFKGWEVPAANVADTSDILKRHRRKRKTRAELEEEHYAAQILKDRLEKQQAATIKAAAVVKPKPTSIRNYATDKAVVEGSLKLLQAQHEQQQKIAKAKQSSLTALMLFANMLESAERIEIARKPTASKQQQNLATLLLLAVGKDE